MDKPHINGGNVTTIRNCVTCGRPVLVKLVRDIASNEAVQVYWQCQVHMGGVDRPRQSISHDKIKALGINIDLLPVVNNNSLSFVCVVCGHIGAANHHFAPRHLFGDECEIWTQAYLCETCHKRWHDLVTPEMCKHGKL